MRQLLKWFGVAVLVTLFGAVAALLLGPVPQVDLTPQFNDEIIGDDLDAWLQKQEQAFPGIIPGTERQIVWAGPKGIKTPLAVVYLHGFSGTSVDISPVHDVVARELGANLYYSRLNGHGLDGPALGAATPESWIRDTAEALAIGRRLGEKVLVIGTSTGGTLATISALDPSLSKDISGVVLISPNFRMKPTNARILDLGFAPIWAPILTGPEYASTPTSDDHAKYWTNPYPISALFNVATLLRATKALDPTKTNLPLLVLYSPDDQVVDVSYTKSFLANWGGPSRWEARQMTTEDDPRSHMITGDIRSPAQTAPTIALILDWVAGLEN